MTKPLPQRDVTARADRLGSPRLRAVEQKALESIQDENLRRVLGELLRGQEADQENFQEIEQWFPVQPKDSVAPAYEGGGVSGIPFKNVVAGLVSSAGEWTRGGTGATVKQVSKGTYWVTYSFEAETVSVFPQNAGALADWSVVTESETGKERVVVQISDADTAEAINGAFFFTAFEIGKKGNTIVGPEGKEGPTHKTLYHGEGEPGEELGDVDDFYIDIAAWEIYGPKTEEGWGEGASLIGPAGEDGAPGEPGAPGEDGKDGEPGADGEDGRAAGLLYKFLTATTNSDPGAGNLKLNDASADTATFVRLSETDQDGNSLANWLDTWSGSTSEVKGVIVIRSVAHPKRFIVKNVTAFADPGAYRNITVKAGGDAVGEALENEELVTVNFYRTGDKGADGAAGEAGEAGEDGRTILHGNGAPEGKLGEIGDYYIDEETWNLYRKSEAASVITPYHDAVMAEKGLIGFWPLDETAGDFVDDKNSVHGTPEGTLVRGAPSLLPNGEGLCLELKGAGWIEIPKTALQQGEPVAFEAWISAANITEQLEILDLGNQSGAFSLLKGVVELGKHGVASLILSSAALKANTVYHIVVQKSGATHSIYVNGVEVASTVAKAATLEANTTEPKWIGTVAKVSGNFKGKMQYVALYKELLSKAQIEAHYAAASEEATEESGWVLETNLIGPASAGLKWKFQSEDPGSGEARVTGPSEESYLLELHVDSETILEVTDYLAAWPVGGFVLISGSDGNQSLAEVTTEPAQSGEVVQMNIRLIGGSEVPAAGSAVVAYLAV